MNDKRLSNKFYNIAKFKLFKLNRSLTGKDNVKTLNIIKSYLNNLKIKRVKSGTRAFNWKIPEEWNVQEAYIADNKNKKIIDFKNNNLHLVGYSKSVNKKINKNKLLKNLKTLKKFKNAIPYITSYYKKSWGFCTSENKKQEIINNYKPNDMFLVKIKSKHNKKGYMHYGEFFIKGKSKKEILISTYICHPSMANNELSGPIIAMTLIKYFEKKNLNKSLRFIFIPETIGSLYYLSKNLIKLKKNLIFGLNLTCLGDNGNYSYIASKYKNTLTEEIIKRTSKSKKKNIKTYSFLDRGSDERQYLSPGIDLPIITICRSKFGKFKEYHNSMDNFDLVSQKNILESFRFIKHIIKEFQKTVVPKSVHLGEPFLQRKKLIDRNNHNNLNNNYKGREILDILQYCDGTNDIGRIANYTKKKINQVKKIITILKKNNFIRT